MNINEKQRILMMAGWISAKLEGGSDRITLAEMKQLLDSAQMLAKAILHPNTLIVVKD